MNIFIADETILSLPSLTPVRLTQTIRSMGVAVPYVPIAKRRGEDGFVGFLVSVPYFMERSSLLDYESEVVHLSLLDYESEVVPLNRFVRTAPSLIRKYADPAMRRKIYVVEETSPYTLQNKDLVLGNNVTVGNKVVVYLMHQEMLEELAAATPVTP